MRLIARLSKIDLKIDEKCMQGCNVGAEYVIMINGLPFFICQVCAIDRLGYKGTVMERFTRHAGKLIKY